MIPDYQTLMRPVLECAASGEIRAADAVDRLANTLQLTDQERAELLPSGKQTTFSNRVHWAKTYLKQAGLVESTRRGHFTITNRGRAALADKSRQIDNSYLEGFEEFQEFKNRTKDPANSSSAVDVVDETSSTPDEGLRHLHRKITSSVALELLDRVRAAQPAFFEKLIVELLLAMGYGGTSEEAGRALGQSGDDGIDGVIDQDPLGVGQIYLQAKRYTEGNNVSAGAIRDFYGALNLKKASKGIFVTTSSFTTQATQTAGDLSSRIVLIDGAQLARLMIRYNIGCRDEEILYLKRIDEDYFEI
jgi:restriction system protein